MRLVNDVFSFDLSFCCVLDVYSNFVNFWFEAFLVLLGEAKIFFKKICTWIIIEVFCKKKKLNYVLSDYS